MLYSSQNLVGTGRLLIGNKAAPKPPIARSAPSASRRTRRSKCSRWPRSRPRTLKNTYKVEGVLAHYIVFGQESLLVSEGKPMRAVFGQAKDAVIFCYKLGGKMVYLFGITVPALLEWTPPSKAIEMINESAICQSWKATRSDLKELVPLVNTR